MKKKLAALILSVAMCAGLLSGCGGKESPAESTEAPEATEAPAEEEKEEAVVSEAPEEEAQPQETELYVFIAASLANAMEEIQTMYADVAPGVTIRYNADSSGTLQTQIEEGAECDLFFSAATKQMDALTEGGLVTDGTVVNLLENKVVLIKPVGGETPVTGFENITDAANLALAGEDVPVGQYAREIFENLGITDQVMAMEINQGKNVTDVLAAVSEGSNEVGVVYATDAYSVMDSVEILAEAPEGSLKTPVLYPVGLIENPEADDVQTQAAADFLEFLQTPEVLAVFEGYGFSPAV